MELSASLYRLLEQKNISWEDGPALQRWWTRALDGMKSKAAARGAGNRAAPQSGQPRKDDPSKPKTNVAGLPIVWMRDNKICIKFQTGACQETGDHTTTSGITLKHLCGGCRKLNKPDDTSHCAKTCPFKSQFFQ